MKLIIHILLAQKIKKQRSYASTPQPLYLQLRVFRQQKDTCEMWHFKYEDLCVQGCVAVCYQTFRKNLMLSSSGYRQVIFKIRDNLT